MTRWGELDGRYLTADERDAEEAEWRRVIAEIKAAETQGHGGASTD